MMFNLYSILLLPAFSFLVPSLAFADLPRSFELYKTKIDSTVKKCSKSELAIAEEILDLELLGMRYLKSKPSCFKNKTVKFVHVAKNPDQASDSLVSVLEGSEKIESIKYNENFFSYKVVFSVKNIAGKEVKGEFSFVRTAQGGSKKPKRGCARITVSPAVAFVKSSCL